MFQHPQTKPYPSEQNISIPRSCMLLNVSVKNQKNIWILLKLLERWLTYRLKRFWMVFKFFQFCLTLSVPEKLKNLVFETPIIPQNLYINNLRITSAKFINLHTIRKLTKYFLKNFHVKAMFTLTVFKILLVKCKSVLSPVKRCTGSERNNLILFDLLLWKYTFTGTKYTSKLWFILIGFSRRP